ncbi:hypothetical protein Tco_0879890 [Tanacetum coccineum]
MSEEAIAKLKDRIDDEAEGMIVLKGILKRKGLPLNTTYDEYKKLTRTSFDQTFEEFCCDRLFATARKNSSSSSSYEFETIITPVVDRHPPYVITYSDRFDERTYELRARESVNRISYQDVESRNKRYILLKQTSKKNAQLYQDSLAEFGGAPLTLPDPSLFAHLFQ